MKNIVRIERVSILNNSMELTKKEKRIYLFGRKIYTYSKDVKTEFNHSLITV